LTRFMCSNLHGHREELLIIAVDVAAQERYEMLGRRHLASFPPSRDGSRFLIEQSIVPIVAEVITPLT